MLNYARRLALGDLLSAAERGELAAGVLSMVDDCLTAFLARRGIKADADDLEDLRANVILRFFQYSGFFAGGYRGRIRTSAKINGLSDVKRYVNVLTVYTCADYYRLSAAVLDEKTRDFLGEVSPLLLARLEDGGDRWEVDFIKWTMGKKDKEKSFFLVQTS